MAKDDNEIDADYESEEEEDGEGSKKTKGDQDSDKGSKKGKKDHLATPREDNARWREGSTLYTKTLIVRMQLVLDLHCFSGSDLRDASSANDNAFRLVASSTGAPRRVRRVLACVWQCPSRRLAEQERGFKFNRQRQGAHYLNTCGTALRTTSSDSMNDSDDGVDRYWTYICDADSDGHPRSQGAMAVFGQHFVNIHSRKT